MSLFSLATQDKASWIAKLDGNLEEISGNGLITSTCTITGAPTFELSSATAGLGSHLFNQDPGQEMLYYTATRSGSFGGLPVFEAVVKIGTPPVSTSSVERVIVRGETTDGFGARQLSIFQDANGTTSKPRYTASNTGTTTFSVTSNININDGQWHHLMAIESLSSNRTKIDLYVDGVLSASGTAAQNIGREAPNNLRIASRSTGTTFGFYGVIDFAAVYAQGYLLTPTFDSTKVTDHYNSFLSTRDTYTAPIALPYGTQISNLGPKIWYKFDETAGTPNNFGSLLTTSTFTDLLLNEQTDVSGRAVYLNGSSSNVQLPAHSAFSLFNDRSFTVESWVQINNADTNTSGPFEIFRLNPASSPHNAISLTVGGTSANRGKVILNSSWTTELVGAKSVDDGQWHHIAYTYNTSSVKLYIDGQLAGSRTPTSLPASFVYDESTKKLIGAGYTGISQTTIAQYFKGRIDEFAVYDRELTSAEILSNFNSGSSVSFEDSAGTASALIVQPTWAVECVQVAAPMTASALFVETLPSNFDYVDGIQKIISDTSPSQWIKFDSTTDVTRTFPGGFLTNYGSGGASGFTAWAVGDAYRQLGPAQEPRLELKLGAGTGVNTSGFTTTTASTFFTDEVSDNNFSIGIWFKMPSAIDTSEKQIFAYTGGTNSAIGLRVNNKKVVFTVQTSHTTYTHTETNDISENEWHLAVMKLDLAATTIKYYLDGTEVYSDTAIQGTRNTPTTFQFGKNAGNGTDATTKFQEIAHFFVSSYSSATPTVVTNLWNAGTRQNQAKGVMTFPILKFDNKYDQVVASLNPLQQLGFNETTGTVVENVGSNINTSFAIIGANYTRGTSVLTKNRYGYNFTNKNTYVSGAYATPTNSYADNTQTISVYAKQATVTGSDISLIALYGAGNINGSGIGLTIAANASGPYLAISPTTNPANAYVLSSGSTSYFGDWHLYTAVRDGTAVRFYIDGKLVASGTYSATNFTDSGFVAIGGGETVWLGAAAATVDKYIDEFAAFDYALSAQQILDMYQAIEIDRMNATTATFVMPTNIAGTGYTDTPAPMTASGEFVEPGQTDEISLFPDHLEAFAEFLHPNYGGNVVIDANYGHTAATADALFHDPQLQIGDFHSADHMDATALMVHPQSTGGGRITVSTQIGGPAVFVMPGIVTIKGARVFAEPARATAILPLPPAYLTLQDDKWFVTLLEGHADRITEPVQANLGNLPNQTTIDVIKGGFLSFFNEFNTDITTTTQINSIESEIPAHYFDKEDTVRYDSNGNILPLDTSKNVSPARAPRGSSITTPRMGVGYFDNYERKAVRIENIEFPFPGTSSDHSERPYNLEFSIKTTKKDQVLAYGIKTSYLYYSRSVGAIGLSDGKIYLAEDGGIQFSTTGFNRGLFPTSAPHPKKFVNRAQYLLSKTDIADGQWHHVIIQKGYGSENLRTQIWIDGKLDRQIFASDADGRIFYSTTPGLDGTNDIRPYILGFNSNDPLLYSDFETSGWNFYPGRFITSQKTLINYLAYLKYEPIKAEPMLGTVTIGQESTAQGNRGRMLLLYWWRNPVGFNQFVTTRTNPLTTGYDGNNSPWRPEDLIDDPKKGPIYWEGWDVFPVGVIKPGASDVVKLNNVGQDGYLDIENGRLRLLDLQQDLNLSQFDTIMFANYPTTSAQIDEYIREELVDSYFGIKEKDIYEDFLKSLRAAVDSGMSLLVQFDQLARDLKVYDRVERIPVFNEGISDKRAFWHTNNTDWNIPDNVPNKDEDECRLTIDLENGAYFEDRYNNMRHRVVNTVELLTDDPTYIFTDRARYQHSDFLDFGAPDRIYERFEYKNQGLQPGDEFVFGNPSNITQFGNSRARQTSMLAIPFENIKGGRIITAQPEKYWKGDEYVDNPYKNYAHSIAFLPGDVLDGKGVGGKIFVSISEVFWDQANEYRIVDLYSDYWIDISYDLGFFGAVGSAEAIQKRNDLKNTAPSKNPAYVPPTGKTTEHYNWATYWSRNDNFAFTQVDRQQDFGGVLGLLFESSIELERVPTSRKALQSFTRRRDQLGRFASGSGGNGSLFFQLKQGRTTQIMNIFVPTLLTRGFWWLSERERPTGLVQRPEKATASATMPNALAVVDKETNIKAEVMLANATSPSNVTGTITIISSSISIVTLPLIASATIVQLGERVFADPMNATALIIEPGLFTYSLEEVILTIANTEAIVYVRGDKIT